MSKARQAIPTVTFVDEYCQRYQDLFPDVRSAGSVHIATGGHAVRDQTQDASGDCQSGGGRCAGAAPRGRLRTLVGARGAEEASDLLTSGSRRQIIRVVH
jgi:hypothetical protein